MQNQILQPKQRVTALEFSSKFQSKREIYKFLSTECKAYLDTYEALTIW